jgi:hypothetical protein
MKKLLSLFFVLAFVGIANADSLSLTPGQRPHHGAVSLSVSKLTSGTLGPSVGASATSFPQGVVSSGTYTPAASNGNFQHYTNGGAHTLAPPTTICSIVVEMTNNGSAGAVTISGFTKNDGDTITTTNTSKFLFFITKTSSYSYVNVKALQ